MTTTLYLTNSAAPITATAKGGWENTSQNNPHLLGRARGGANTSHAQAETSTSGTYDVALARFISDPLTGGSLPAVTGSDAFSLCIAAQESAPAANDYLYLHIWITQGDNDSVRGTWLANYADTGGSEIPDSAMTGVMVSPTATTTAVTVQPGDRMVVEVGYRATNTSSTSYTGTIRCGGTAADLAPGTSGVTANSPWIQFPSALDGVLGLYMAKTAADGAGAADAAPAKGRATTKRDYSGAADKGAGKGFGRVSPGSANTAGAADAKLAVKGLNRSDGAGVGDAIAPRIMTVGRQPKDAARTHEHVAVDFTRTELSDYQFELETAPGSRFGWGETIVVEEFDPGTSDSRNQDQAGLGDYRSFGRDYRTPPTWSWSLWTDCRTPADALGWIEQLAAAWDAPDVRSTPGAVLALRYKVAGRIRRVYGRPRDLDTPPPNLIQTGRVHLQASFVLADGLFYDDEENSVSQNIAAMETTGGGFTLPLVLPFVSAPEPEPRQELVRIGGTRPTWVDLVFHGPANNPWVVLGGSYHYALRGSIGLNRSVTISGKPWSMGITREDGTAVPEMLDPRARLADLRLRPGDYGVQHGGYATSTGGGVEIRWHNAYHTM